ncbi:sialic acid binding Ig-like lectin 10 [Sarotherodon galilaeus]
MSKYINYCVLVLLWIIFFHFCLGNYLSQEWGRWRFARCCSGHASGGIQGFLLNLKLRFPPWSCLEHMRGSAFKTTVLCKSLALPLISLYFASQRKSLSISGKFDNNYIYQVIFGTSRGRSLIVGQPTQGSFNFYPTHPDAELRLLSGRFNGNGITSLGAHWGVVFIH